MGETVLVAQLYRAIIDALSVQGQLTPLYPGELSVSLREAVCTKGLGKEANLGLLHVIEQLASFRAGTKTSDEFRLALEGYSDVLAATSGVNSMPCELAESILALSKCQAAARRSKTPSTPPISPPHTPPHSPTYSLRTPSRQSCTPSPLAAGVLSQSPNSSGYFEEDNSSHDSSEEQAISSSAKSENPVAVEEEKDEERNGDDTNDDCRLMLSFPLPQHKVALLTGYGGNTVKGIERRTGAKVDVLGKASEDKMVVIRGKSDGCQAALAEVKHIMNSPHYSKGMLYGVELRFLAHRDAFNEIYNIADACRCTVKELVDVPTGFGSSGHYLFIEGNLVGNVQECASKISDLEGKYLGLNRLEVKTTVLPPSGGLLQYDREELINLKTDDLPSPLSAEAAKMIGTA